MITAAELLKNGYRQFQHKELYCVGAFQKTVCKGDSSTKLYFITIFLWDFNFQPSLNEQNRVSVNVRLYLSNDPKDSGGLTINPSLDKSWSIDDIESFYSWSFRRLNCVPDVHNN